MLQWMERVSRILVCAPEPHAIKAAVFGVLIAKLAAYEPDLVDLIRNFVTHMSSDEMHRVGDKAFEECCALSEVVLPRSITHVGSMAFHKCTSLTSVTLPESLTHIDTLAFNECTALPSVALPNSLQELGTSAFRGCTSLALMTLPDSLTILVVHGGASQLTD